jgi:hypothetical protein
MTPLVWWKFIGVSKNCLDLQGRKGGKQRRSVLLACILELENETASSCQTQANVNQTPWRHIPEDQCHGNYSEFHVNSSNWEHFPTLATVCSQ